MPRKGKNGQSSNGDWRGFVSVPLPNTVTVDVVREATNGQDILSILEELALAGYKVSLSISDNGQGDASVASATGKRGPNRGYTLTTWGGSPERAILGLWYKIAVICDWEQWEEKALPEGAEL